MLGYAITYLLNLNTKFAAIHALTKSLDMIRKHQSSDFKECMNKTLDEKFAEQATPIANQTSLIMDHTHKLSFSLQQRVLKKIDSSQAASCKVIEAAIVVIPSYFIIVNQKLPTVGLSSLLNRSVEV